MKLSQQTKRSSNFFATSIKFWQRYYTRIVPVTQIQILWTFHRATFQMVGEIQTAVDAWETVLMHRRVSTTLIWYPPLPKSLDI